MPKKSAYVLLAVAVIAAVAIWGIFSRALINAPEPQSADQTPGGNYPLTQIAYSNASKDMIQVELPFPGAVVGKEFSVLGQARGPWFFEASFPVEVLDRDGQRLAQGIAQAQGEWMTESFVPFRADIKIPESYIGPATLVLRRDNPSGLPQNEASAWFPITIEY